MISVIAKVPVKPEVKDEAIEAVKELMKGVATEEGTLHYTLNIDQNDPNTFVFMERYTDMDALGIHGSTEHFMAFMGKVGNFAGGPPEIITMDEIASI